MTPQLKIKIVRKNGKIPARATQGSAALDLCAAVDLPVTILPHSFLSIPCGIAIELPDSNCAALVVGRSGLGFKHGITLVNSVGIIDSDYRGEICVGLINHSDSPFTINCGDRIAQMLVINVMDLPVLPSEELGETERGQRGFGSTGIG